MSFILVAFCVPGVYQVNIDAEQQKVTVSGGVDAGTLIKKLVKAGKHAELWSQKSSQNHQKQKGNCLKDNKNNNKGRKQGLTKGLEALKNQQQKFPCNLQEDESFLDDDDEEEVDDEHDEIRFIREKSNHLNLLRQQAVAMEGNNGKKNFGAIATAAAAPNNGKMNNAKKGNANQNMGGIKGNQGGIGIDQKTMAALKNNGQLGGANVNNTGGEAKIGNDISTMMSLAGFHGNGGTTNLAALLGGGNPNNIGNFHHQIQASNNGFVGSSSAGRFPTAVNGYQQYPSSSMLMNLQNRQPQMMYNRSPFIPSSTAYFYNYGRVPNPTAADHYYHSGADQSAAATHMFSDDNISSCSIM